MACALVSEGLEVEEVRVGRGGGMGGHLDTSVGENLLGSLAGNETSSLTGKS
jgi:hypothetical protein